MSFDPAAFAKVAAELTNPKARPGEAHVRTACGRAYYAAFLTARERLEAIGHNLPSDGRVHGEVIWILTGAKDATVLGLGQALQNLKGIRRDADYVLQGPYRSKATFEQAFGALSSLTAENWLDRFRKLATSQLPTK